MNGRKKTALLLAAGAVSAAGGIVLYVVALGIGPPEWIAGEQIDLARDMGDLARTRGLCRGPAPALDAETASLERALIGKGWSPTAVEHAGAALLRMDHRIVAATSFGFDERFYYDPCNQCWLISRRRFTALDRCERRDARPS